MLWKLRTCPFVTFQGNHQHIRGAELLREMQEAGHFGQVGIDQVQVRGVEGQPDQRGRRQAEGEQQQGQDGTGPADGEASEERE